MHHSLPPIHLPLKNPGGGELEAFTPFSTRTKEEVVKMPAWTSIKGEGHVRLKKFCNDELTAKARARGEDS